MLACSSCGDDVAVTSDTDPSTTGGAQPSTDALPTTSGMGAEDTGSQDTSTTGDPDDPPGSGAARVLYLTRGSGPDAPGNLFVVDCSGPTPGPPVQVNEPLAPGTAIGFSTVPLMSPSRRWLAYIVYGAEGAAMWFVRLDGPTLGVPRRVELPLRQQFQLPMFSHDERVVAFGAGKDELYVCTLAEDGSCAPTLVSPPLAEGGSVWAANAAVSSDGGMIAYPADLDGDGKKNNMFLVRTGPDDAGTIVQVSDVPDDVEALDGSFTPEGDVLYFQIRSTELGGRELYAVDLTIDPPSPPVLLSPPLDDPSFSRSSFRLRDDATAALMRTDAGLMMLELDGLSPGSQVLLSDPLQGATSTSLWIGDGQSVIYLAPKPDEQDAYELWRADVGGPPQPPVRIGAPLAPGDRVDDFPFGGDGTRYFYTIENSQTHDDTLWMLGVDSGAQALEVSAPMPPAMYLSAASVEIAEGHGRVTYASQLAVSEHARRYVVELAGSSGPVMLDRDGGSGVGDDFSADGKHLFFTGSDHRVYQVDVVPSVGASAAISGEGHEVTFLIVLPPGG